MYFLRWITGHPIVSLLLITFFYAMINWSNLYHWFDEGEAESTHVVATHQESGAEPGKAAVATEHAGAASHAKVAAEVQHEAAAVAGVQTEAPAQVAAPAQQQTVAQTESASAQAAAPASVPAASPEVSSVAANPEKVAADSEPAPEGKKSGLFSRLFKRRDEIKAASAPQDNVAPVVAEKAPAEHAVSAPAVVTAPVQPAEAAVNIAPVPEVAQVPEVITETVEETVVVTEQAVDTAENVAQKIMDSGKAQAASVIAATTAAVTAAVNAVAPESEPVEEKKPEEEKTSLFGFFKKDGAAKDDAAAKEAPAAEDAAKASEAPAVEDNAKASEAPAAEDNAKASEAPVAEDNAKASEAPAAEDNAKASETPVVEEAGKKSFFNLDFLKKDGGKKAEAVKAPVEQADTAVQKEEVSAAAPAPAAQATTDVMTPPSAPAPASSEAAAQNPLTSALAAARDAFWRQDFKAANAIYQNLIASDSENPDLLGEYGNMLVQSGNLPAAMENYEKSAYLLIKQNRLKEVHPLVGFIGQFDRDRAARIMSKIRNQE
ncbi:MAG TPA: hypothetical protein ENJ84_07750 [Gammaproteobacteria bacterium]|nr:hypothetical protein [Gammaproteobacteria bacterium]